MKQRAPTPRPGRRAPYDPARIARKRTESGLTQAELSKLAQVSPQHVSALENGLTGCSISTLRALAMALNCTVKELLAEPEAEAS